MKKERIASFTLISILTILFLVSLVSAADEDIANLTGFEKSYACLKDKIEEKSVNSLTTEELAFSLLAMGYDNSLKADLKEELENKGSEDECWPKDNCNLRETSLVLLAFNHIEENTKEIESWLLNQTIKPSELVWYLQIDANEKTECTLYYDNSSRKITVREDKTISGAGGCFKSAYNGYWLEIDVSCYDKEFDVSCDKDFVTALAFKKKTSSTYYISANTNTAAPGGETTEKVESLCFKQGSSCSYEGSLWASLALQKRSKDIKPYLPYLMAMSQENPRLIPSAFLYSLTGFDEYYNELINQQNTKGYWQLSDTSRRYYDTALALLSLYGKSSEAGQKAIDYLLEPNVQQDGCWQNSIRDTAFILYAASPKRSSSGISTRSQCKDFSDYYCMSSTECEEINGSSLDNFACFGGQICCSKKIVERTCSEKEGIKCLSSEECTGSFTSASDTSYCCLNGECQEREEEPTITQCELLEYNCKAQCSSSETPKQYECSGNEICCAAKPKKSYWWLWLLIFLVILLVLAIIFRNQLKIWVFKTKNKFSKGPVNQQKRPPMPPAGRPMPLMGMPRRIIPGQMPMRRPMLPRPMPPRFSKDKELDETLKKIREMGK